MYGGNLNDVELYKGACIITKIVYVVQCSLDLELHIPYGGNLNNDNDVELCERACIYMYNKDCVCYAVLLELLYYFYYHNHAHDTVYDNYVCACMYMYVCMYACISCTSHEAHSV